LSITRKKENRSIGYHFSLGGYHWDTGHNHWRKLDWDKIIGVNWRLCFLGLTGTQSPGSGLAVPGTGLRGQPAGGSERLRLALEHHLLPWHRLRVRARPGSRQGHESLLTSDGPPPRPPRPWQPPCRQCPSDSARELTAAPGPGPPGPRQPWRPPSPSHRDVKVTSRTEGMP
jgi:hypothetical protein